MFPIKNCLKKQGAAVTPLLLNCALDYAIRRVQVIQDGLTLTHCGRVTQICVLTLQLCKTDDANLRF